MPRSFRYLERHLIASNPLIEICDANKQEGDAVAETAMVFITRCNEDENSLYDGRSIAAVVGPIACTGCEVNCTDAYLTIEHHVLEMLENVGVKRSTTPVDIRLLKRKVTTNTTDVQPAFDRSVDAATGSNSYGWESKCERQITNDVIDVSASAVVSVGPDGTLALHPEFFQPELTTSPSVDIERVYNLVEPNGQGRLF